MSPAALLILFWAFLVMCYAIIKCFSDNVRTILKKRSVAF